MAVPTKLFRLFVSSPDDADVERRRAEGVVSRLNGDFAGAARLETVRYETRFYQAHLSPQEQIPPPTECDLVVGVFRWRLGTPLSPEFPERMPDGRAYPSGTAYELLTAIGKRQAGANLPDIYVFRFMGSAPNPPLDDPNYDRIKREWESLSAFIAEWFRAPEGHFKAYFHSYGKEDDFEAQLETLLRQWLAEKVAGGRMARWSIAIKGSPFRGLDAFGAMHASVFFGRSREVARAVDLCRKAAARLAPFLLLLGPSGAGKSSLARAGVLTRLTTPGVIAEVDAWRTAVMRPGDDAAGPFAALAAALFLSEADLPKDEEGRGPALPELAKGDFQTPANLAAALRHADATAVKPILNALSRVGEAMRARERYDRDPRCDLVLLVDQLDELFVPAIAAAERDAFISLLAAFVATGRIWVALTLRDAFYPQVLASPVLSALKEHGASLDVAPPGAAELAEIVRAPADAAGLLYEKDAASGETLDSRILREADEPDMLPLVQLALTRLYEARDEADGRVVLTLKAYEGLGGLKGIVDEAGEKALGALNEEERARLPPLLRQLAVPAQGGDGPAALTIRSIALAIAAPDAAARKLVDALVRERVLTTRAFEVKTQIVRLAHQRVLTDWTRAARIVADSADFYRIRDEVEDQRRRWEAGKRRGELLLVRGLPLAEARDMAAHYGAELSPATLAFIGASRRRANRAQAIAWAAAAVFALVAVGAGVAAKMAVDQKQIADRNFAAAKATVDGLIFNIADGLRNVAGMRVETISKILETTRKTVDQLLATAPNDPRLLRSRAAMLIDFARTYQSAGDLKDALAAAAESLDIDRKLAHDVPVGLDSVGNVKLQAGDQAGALAAYQESLDIDRKLAAQDPGNAQVQRAVSISLDKVGDVKLQSGDQAGALAAYQESLDILRKLSAQHSGNAQAQLDVSLTLDHVGDVKLQSGDQAGALAAYQESLDIRRKLVEQDPGDAQAQRDVSVSLNEVGYVERQAGDQVGALAAYQESLDIARKLAALDPGNAEAQRDVSVVFERLGDVKLQSGDQAGALAAYQESLDIDRKLWAQDPGDTWAQRDIGLTLDRLGYVKLQAGDRAGALAAYQESLDIARKLAAQDPGNARPQRDMSVSLIQVGDVKWRAGDQAGALAAYQESLDIARKLAAQDTGNAQARRDVSVGVDRLGDVKRQAGDLAGALAAYQEGLDILRKLAAQDPGNAQAQRDVSASLDKVGDVKLRGGDQSGALAAYQEGLDIARKLAAQDPGNAQVQRDLSLGVERLGTIKRRADDQAGALAAYQEGLDIRRKLAALDPGNAEAQRDLSISLNQVGEVKLQAGDQAGALAADQESLDIARKLAAQDPGNARTQRDLAFALGNKADAALMVKDFAEALALSDEAIALAPGQLWLYTNRADALMLLGRSDEARAIYLEFRGKMSNPPTLWERDVESDFTALRKAGISNPLMDEIEADFAKPAVPTSR